MLFLFTCYVLSDSSVRESVSNPVEDPVVNPSIVLDFPERPVFAGAV
jgi:hypothetical protein